MIPLSPLLSDPLVYLLKDEEGYDEYVYWAKHVDAWRDAVDCLRRTERAGLRRGCACFVWGVWFWPWKLAELLERLLVQTELGLTIRS